MTETTHQPSTLHAYFGYRDAPAAIEWLGQVFGFETTMLFPDDDRGITHAELRLGNAAILVFSDRDGYQRPPRKGDTMGYGTYLCFPETTDVDAAYARALVAGATPVWAPRSTEWGNYLSRVLDPEGFEWSFGTHRPGEPQDDWSEGE